MCCSFIVFLQYLRVVVWLVGQGLLPEQSGKHAQCDNNIIITISEFT